MKDGEENGGNPSISPGGRSRESKYIFIFGGDYQKMATEEMHLNAVLQNGSARLECEKGYCGDAGSLRFPFHPEK